MAWFFRDTAQVLMARFFRNTVQVLMARFFRDTAQALKARQGPCRADRIQAVQVRQTERTGIDLKKDTKINLIRTLEQELNYKRFVHTLAVAGTAASLAMCYGADVEKAETAGLLHDCAKCIDVRKMQRLCERAGLEISPFEKNSGSLLHSKAGSVLAAEKYGITDPDMINAIRYHTTGRPGMSLLEKIIFVADYIEPGRFTAKNLPLIRKMAFSDIDEALLKILYDTLVYLNSTGNPVDPMTQRTYDYYRRVFADRNRYD